MGTRWMSRRAAVVAVVVRTPGVFGVGNRASAAYATVTGGENNRAGAVAASVSGGHGNIAASRYTAVGGGCFERRRARRSVAQERLQRPHRAAHQLRRSQRRRGQPRVEHQLVGQRRALQLGLRR
jgi:hypothetical protein